MNSFIHIISSFFPDIDIHKTAFDKPYNRNTLINQDFISYSFLNTLHFNCLNKTVTSKFKIMNESILQNRFISFEKKDELFNIFYLSQKIYRAFCKLARSYKLKKAKYFDTDTDLFMIPFSNYKPHMLIDIYDIHNSIIYKFKITDLITIINTALCYSSEFFIEIQDIKNPYTNLPFTTAQLYHIYSTIKKSEYRMPPLFHMFFIESFNYDNFLLNNESLIR